MFGSNIVYVIAQQENGISVEKDITLRSSTSYYLSLDVQKWINEKALLENRTKSNCVETILRQVKDESSGRK
jgi:hypothetical protein